MGGVSLKNVLPFDGLLEYYDSMSIDQIASEALRLSVKERAQLAGSLWESLQDPGTSQEMDDATAMALALERDREIETGVVKAVSHDALMDKLRR